MTFFLGAGASAASPACLPQPHLIQTAAFDAVAPSGAAADREFIANTLPEIYHEALLAVGGEETRAIWKSLALWENSEHVALRQLDPGPNVVHLLTVYLAWKAGTPVITVNFDEMLERAAARLGLRAEVKLGARGDRESVAIWKLHGTVCDLSSIRTTLQGITATNAPALAAIEGEFSRSTGCLIGYSGRDIDFFPFLCGWSPAHSVYWLSLRLDETAIHRYPNPFIGVEAPAEVWARRVIAQIPDDELGLRLRREMERDLAPRERFDAIYERLVPELASRTYREVFPIGNPKRLLAHAMALFALGRNIDAERNLDEILCAPGGSAVLSAPLATRAHILKSALGHEFARYRASANHARQAIRLADSHGLEAPACEARLRLDEAYQMMYLPPAAPFVRRGEYFNGHLASAGIRFLFHAWRFRSRRQMARISAGYADVRATFEYIEHLVRVGALFQGLAERLPWTRAVTRAFALYWHWLEERSYGAGYALGIGNSKKFRLRHVGAEVRNREALPVLGLYELVPSPTGGAIYERDVAEVARIAGQEATDDQTREARRLEANMHFERALDSARMAGDPSLELKIMIGMKQLDDTNTWPRDEVERLLRGIESPLYAKLHQRIVEFLVAQ